MRCVSPISVKDPRYNRGSIRVVVPCGKCGACRSTRRANWSFRIAEEFRHAISARFLTLTYEDSMLPREEGIPTLVKKHTQLWLKKLRKINDGRLRYYLVGEYGGKTGRPHYHVALFNAVGDYEDHIQICWSDGKSNPRGFVHIGFLEPASIHYLVKYHVNYDKEKFKGLPIAPEFATMSRNPGIGYQYVERVGLWNRLNGKLYLVNNGFKQPLPRYYKEKVFSSVQKQVLQAEAISEADREYIREVVRLDKLGYDNPTQEYERRMYEKALKLMKDAKGKSKF